MPQAATRLHKLRQAGAEGPPTAFVQDHFRQVVKPSYTNVFRERNGVLGVVEFDTREDLDRAIRWGPVPCCLPSGSLRAAHSVMHAAG